MAASKEAAIFLFFTWKQGSFIYTPRFHEFSVYLKIVVFIWIKEAN